MTPLEGAVLNEYYNVAQLLLEATKSNVIVKTKLSKKNELQDEMRLSKLALPALQISNKCKDSYSLKKEYENHIKPETKTGKELITNYQEDSNGQSQSCEKMSEHIEKQVFKTRTLKECQEDLISLIQNRKMGSTEFFISGLNALQETNMSPQSHIFNRALQMLVQPSKTSKKNPNRGTCYTYTKELLQYGSFFKDLKIDAATIDSFRNNYRPFHIFLRKTFNLRNKEFPLVILEKFRDNN